MHDIDVNKKIATQFLDWAFTMEMSRAISMLSDDATWWVIGDPQRVAVAGLKNRERTVLMMTNMHRALPHGMQHRFIGTTAEGERVAIEVEAEGRWHDGTPYRNTYHFMFRIIDRKVAAIREYMDPSQIPNEKPATA